MPTKNIYADGSISVCNENGGLHSYNDEPSYIAHDGTLYWHKDGRSHRDYGPAIIYLNGRKEWLKDGFYYEREDGPSIISSTGNKEYYIDNIGWASVEAFWKHKISKNKAIE